MKVKQKISGCFRRFDGARFRSFIGSWGLIITGLSMVEGRYNIHISSLIKLIKYIMNFVVVILVIYNIVDCMPLSFEECSKLGCMSLYSQNQMSYKDKHRTVRIFQSFNKRKTGMCAYTYKVLKMMNIINGDVQHYLPSYSITRNLSAQCTDSLVNKSRQSASIVIKEIFSEADSLPEHFLFSIGDKWYLVFERRDEDYFGYQACLTASNIPVIKPIEANLDPKYMSQLFNADTYYPGVIDLNSSFYYNRNVLSSGNTTYSYYQKVNREKIGEYRLTVVINPDPMPKPLKNYLFSLLLPLLETSRCE